MRFCTNCGQRIADSECFCTNCGTPVAVGSEPLSGDVITHETVSYEAGTIEATADATVQSIIDTEVNNSSDVSDKEINTIEDAKMNDSNQDAPFNTRQEQPVNNPYINQGVQTQNSYSNNGYTQGAAFNSNPQQPNGTPFNGSQQPFGTQSNSSQNRQFGNAGFNQGAPFNGNPQPQYSNTGYNQGPAYNGQQRVPYGNAGFNGQNNGYQYNNPGPVPPYGQVPYAAARMNPNDPELIKRNLEKSRTAASSVWMIIMTVCFGIMTFCSVYNIFVTNTVPQVVYDMFDRIGINTYDLYELINGSSIITKAFNVIFLMPAIVALIGMIMVLGNSSRSPMPTSGFTMIQVNAVFKLICVCLGGVGLIVAFGLSIGLSGSYFSERFKSYFSDFNAYRGAGVLLFIFMIVIIIIAMVLLIIYYAKIIGMLRCAKVAGSTGIVYRNKMSMFVAVIGFIIACVSIISFIDMLSDISKYSTVSIISDVANILFFISSSIAIICYRTALESR